MPQPSQVASAWGFPLPRPYKIKNTHQEAHAAGRSVYQDVIFDTKPICTISPETALFLGFFVFCYIERKVSCDDVFIGRGSCCAQHDTPFCNR